MKHVISLLIAILLMPFTSSAGSKKTVLSAKDSMTIQSLAEKYYSSIETVSNEQQALEKDCSSSSESMQCMKYICEMKFNCSENDMLQVARACRGNPGSSCVSYICGIKHECNFHEIVAAANACKANEDTRCIKYICELNYNCSFDGLLQAAQSCGGNDL